MFIENDYFLPSIIQFTLFILPLTLVHSSHLIMIIIVYSFYIHFSSVTTLSFAFLYLLFLHAIETLLVYLICKLECLYCKDNLKDGSD